MEIELIAKHVARSTAGRSSIGRRVASTQATPIAASHNRQSTAPHCPPSGRGGPGVSNHHVVIGPAVKFVMQPIIGLPVYEQSKAAGGRLSDDSEMVSRGGNHGPRRFRHLVSRIRPVTVFLVQQRSLFNSHCPGLNFHASFCY